LVLTVKNANEGRALMDAAKMVGSGELASRITKNQLIRLA
jgi:hypothetical protein